MKDNFKLIYADRVGKAIDARSVKVSELEKRLGMSRERIFGLTRFGANIVDIVVVAKALGVSVSYLAGFDCAMDEDAMAEDLEADGGQS